ncbi:MAG: hypothetical protein GY737_19835 [Desulfobacteraceae bacterium]|nr:hypothetical protein [Desulfobacteraceae bacterium]
MNNQRTKSNIGFIFFPLISLIILFLISPAQAAHNESSGMDATLPPFQPPQIIDGSGRKLLVIYMVGSDLESDGGAATSDLTELIDGYNIIDQDRIEVVVAFGGANKFGWQGMKFADISQIIEDASDGQFGNTTPYLYRADFANMGDKSSLTLFLEYVTQKYKNFDSSFLTFWNHGGAYTGFGNDEVFGYDSLSLTDIDNALTDSKIGEFDLIGFDACLMGSMEVARFIEPHAKYLLASEELEPGHGWHWKTVIQAFSDENDIVKTGMAIIDLFVLNIHDYESDGKTLSLLDLSRFDTLVDSIDSFSTSFSTNLLSDNDYSDALIYGSTHTAEFGRQSKEDQRVSIDLKDFAQTIRSQISDFQARETLDNLAASVDDFVVYAKNDGTRPNANGVTIAPPEKINPSWDSCMLNSNWLEFQATFDILKKNDTTSPEVVDVNDDADSDDFNWNDNGWDDDGWDDDGWDDLYDRKGLHSNALAEPNDQLKRVDHNGHSPGFLSGERAAFIHTGHDPAMRKSSAASGTKGFSAKFSDPNLAKVTTIFGFEFAPYENEPDNRFFMSVAEVQAYSTTTPGVYFTPQWNQKWYCVEYDPDAAMTEWMPLVFQGRYTKDGKEYTKYSAEIDYIESGKDYSEYDYPADLATLKIIVDENNHVVSHHIRTYKIIYAGEDNSEETIIFDKKTKKISKGDQIQFWTLGFSLDGNSEDTWFTTGDTITFTQAPVFTLEELNFEDEQGSLLEYKYAMWAEDISKNGTLTTPFAAAPPDNDEDEDDDDNFIQASCFISTIAGPAGSAGAMKSVAGIILLITSLIQPFQGCTVELISKNIGSCCVLGSYSTSN